MRPATVWILLLCLGVMVSATAAAERNVILYVVDDQGLDAGCYGNQVIQTPHLDALASAGTRFDYAFCTTSTCSASRSVILTGMHNHANGQYGHQHSYHHFATFPGLKSLPAYLSDGGYRTLRTGKYHVAPPEVYAFDQQPTANTRSPVEMADKCEEFIRRTDDRPFFLYFCTSDPHRSGGKLDDSPYSPDRFGNQPGGYPGVEEITYQPDQVIVPPFLPDTPECRAELAQYYQSVTRVDQGLGRLVEILKAAKRYDDTLIIYISDNGIAFAGGKTTLYEPGMRLPCVVRNPYQDKCGNVSNAMITWADLCPTILDFARCLPERSTIQGRSFLDVMDEETPRGWDEVFASHTFHEITMYYPMRVVRGQRYKLIWNIAHGLPYPFASDLWESATYQAQLKQGMDAIYGKRTLAAYNHRPKFELFDLENDPNEAHNLADDPKYADLLETMQAKLKAFQKRTKDPWILKWEYE